MKASTICETFGLLYRFIWYSGKKPRIVKGIGIHVKKELSNLLELGNLHQPWDIKRKNLENEPLLQDDFRKSEDVSIEASRQPLVVSFIEGLDVEPEGIHPCFLQRVEVLRCETVAIRFDQHPEVRLRLNETGAFNVKLRATGEISSRESHDIAGRTPSLRAEENLFFPDHLGAEGRALPMHHASPAASAGIRGHETLWPVCRGSRKVTSLSYSLQAFKHIGGDHQFPVATLEKFQE